MASLVPTLLQISMELTHLAPAAHSRFPLGKLTGTQPSANGLTLDAKFRSDGALRVAESMKLDDPIVALSAAITSVLFSLFRQCCSLRLGW